ncbi:hypothetical protein [Microbacterium sp. gxy059]|uniref:hypothetical protein n=1 Tax=Microbacterium sp. gxy059 TaxID=2957199 RepID=UPI003D97E9E5
MTVIVLLCATTLAVVLTGHDAPSRILPSVWSIWGEWGRASGAHMPWTAPALLAILGLLVTFANAVFRGDTADSADTRHAVTALAHVFTAFFATWTVFVIAGLTASPLGTEAADLAERREAISGLLLIAVPALLLGLASGRFLLAPLTARIANARESIRRLREEISWLDSRSSHASNRVLVLRTYVLLGVFPVGTFLAVIAVGAMTSMSWQKALPLAAVCLVANLFTAYGTCVLLFARAQPPGLLWSPGPVGLHRRRRQLKPFGKVFHGFGRAFFIFGLIVQVFLWAAACSADATAPGHWLALSLTTCLGVAPVAAFIVDTRSERSSWMGLALRTRVRSLEQTEKRHEALTAQQARERESSAASTSEAP